MKNIALTLIGLLVLSSLAFAADPTPNWPWWRGPEHDGKSTDTGLLKSWPEGGPPLEWKVDGIGKGFSSVSVANDTVYITGDKDGRLILHAFTLAGEPKWSVPLDKAYTRSHPGSRGSPTVDGKLMYVLSGNGLLTCVSAANGKGVWAKDLRRMGGRPGGWGYAESPLVQGNALIVKPGGKATIVALNKLTGKGIWATTDVQAGPEYSSCKPFTFGGVPLIVTGTRAGLVCVYARNGKLAWGNSFCANNTANCPTPAVSDGYVFWSNGYGKGAICMKLSAAGGKVTAEEAYRTREMVCHHGGYVIHEGYVYGNDGGGWACLDLPTGKVQWKERAVGKGSLCWADGMLYLFGERGGQAALATCSPEGMKVTGQVRVEGSGPSWAHPVVTGGRLYLRYDDNLYCFDVRAK